MTAARSLGLLAAMSDPVALVTAEAARSLDADLPLLGAALERLGVASEVVVWDDPTIVWGRFARIVVRSTWDYPGRLDAFLAWVAGTAELGPLDNPEQLLRWSLDKRYLADLEARGVAIVPTRFCAPGQAPTLPDRPFVIKPSVGAGSVGVVRFVPGEQAQAHEHVARLHAAGRVAMIQPYLAAVDQRGETALVYFAGRFSHAIRKSAILVEGLKMVDGLYAAETITATVPTPAELALAEAALAATPGRPLYARVDMIPGDDGAPRVLELELCEPSLFLEHGEGAADRFAAAIAASL